VSASEPSSTAASTADGTVATVGQLWRYPVKSMQGERLPRVHLTDGGVPDDRRFAVRPEGDERVLAGKRTPALLGALGRVAAPHGVEIILPDGLRLLGAGSDTAAALSAWLGQPVRLEEAGTAPAAYDVPLDDGTVVTVPCPAHNFSDSASSTLHLVTRPTVGDDDVRRYRPNVVIDVDGPAHLEDDWVGRTLRIGAAEVEVVKPCARCVIVTHPQPGIEADRSRLTGLTERGGALGVLARVTAPGRVRVGDPVLVT